MLKPIGLCFVAMPIGHNRSPIHAGMEVIRKDREFREFLKKNPEIPG